MDISKPLKANLSFTKLDQINNLLKKIRSTHSKETSAPSDTSLNKDEFPTSKCYRGKFSKSKVHGDGTQKIPFQENMWRTVSCFQKISVHTTQIVVSMETVPHPSKPCLLASLSTLSGSLNVKATQKIPGKSEKGREGDDNMVCWHLKMCNFKDSYYVELKGVFFVLFFLEVKSFKDHYRGGHFL